MIRLGLLIWAVAGPALFAGVTGAAMLIREHIVVSGAVEAERNKQVSLCNDRIATEARENNIAVDESVESALEAVRARRMTPADEAALIAMCKASASCLERESLP